MKLEQAVLQRLDSLRLDKKQAQWVLFLAIILHIAVLYIYIPPKAARRMDVQAQATPVIDIHRFMQRQPENDNQNIKAPKKRVFVKPVPQPSSELPQPVMIETDVITNYDPGDFEMPDPAPLPSEPIRLRSDVKPPRLIHSVRPDYPSVYIKLGVQGYVNIEAVISKDGAVTDARVVKSLHRDLDEKALEAVRQWRYEPAMLNDTPIAILMNLTVTFRIE